jgi:Calcineurin-like phosphoesterase
VRTFAVSDVHGYADKLCDALHRAGLTDERGDWAGRPARLWFLGDYFDRGPDGIAVVDLVRRLAGQAAGSQGEVRALLGNHEVLALGMHRFGTTEVPYDGVLPRTFERSWVLNGGRDSDQERLTDNHVEWLLGLPMLALDGDHLLLHSDTTEYLEWGGSVDEINATARDLLRSDDISTWWEIWRLMTSRYAFRGRHGAAVAGRLLDRLGGRRIVHGHSPIADLAGVEPAALTAPVLYADGKVLGIDGAIFDNGPCLVAELTP